MFYIVSYDIPDDKTRNKVAKVMLDFGARVQYSVFECNMDDKLLEKMTQKISKIISDEDSVRIYTLCGKCDKFVKIFGKGEVSKDKDVYIL
ncbi:MAG: CRISPR-associated endonuclease Cas2 [Nitrospirae bacterium]|nr:CRISPR-associated endonuclease Cas2 [Nitrospirota bacterium]